MDTFCFVIVDCFLSAPRKPANPSVESIAVDKVRVTYNYSFGGGYTHEFLVMYRKKCEYTCKMRPLVRQTHCSLWMEGGFGGKIVSYNRSRKETL